MCAGVYARVRLGTKWVSRSQLKLRSELHGHRFFFIISHALVKMPIYITLTLHSAFSDCHDFLILIRFSLNITFKLHRSGEQDESTPGAEIYNLTLGRELNAPASGVFPPSSPLPWSTNFIPWSQVLILHSTLNSAMFMIITCIFTCLLQAH